MCRCDGLIDGSKVHLDAHMNYVVLCCVVIDMYVHHIDKTHKYRRVIMTRKRTSNNTMNTLQTRSCWCYHQYIFTIKQAQVKRMNKFTYTITYNIDYILDITREYSHNDRHLR